MPRVIHFEIPADEPEQAAAFYSQVFGWQIHKAEGFDYWLINTGEEPDGINGGMMKRHHPGQPVTNVIDVPSVDDYLEKITAAGGEIALPKMPVQGVGYLAYFKDPAGNVTGIMQPDSSAA